MVSKKITDTTRSKRIRRRKRITGRVRGAGGGRSENKRRIR